MDAWFGAVRESLNDDMESICDFGYIYNILHSGQGLQEGDNPSDKKNYNQDRVQMG